MNKSYIQQVLGNYNELIYQVNEYVQRVLYPSRSGQFLTSLYYFDNDVMCVNIDIFSGPLCTTIPEVEISFNDFINWCNRSDNIKEVAI